MRRNQTKVLAPVTGMILAAHLLALVLGGGFHSHLAMAHGESTTDENGIVMHFHEREASAWDHAEELSLPSSGSRHAHSEPIVQFVADRLTVKRVTGSLAAQLESAPAIVHAPQLSIQSSSSQFGRDRNKFLRSYSYWKVPPGRSPPSA